MQQHPEQYPRRVARVIGDWRKTCNPSGLEGKQKLYVITKKSETEHEEIVHEEVAFVPMLPGVSNGDI